MAYEQVHFKFDGVVMLQIPRMTSAQRYRASDWPKETKWEGTMKVVSINDKCYIHFLNDGKLFAKCDVTKPNSVTPVVDSGRYFVVVLRHEASGRSMPMGIMFPKAARTNAFDFKVALQDWNSGGNSEQPVKTLEQSLGDFSLGSGGRITVNIKGQSSKPRRTSGYSGGGLAPPGSPGEEKSHKKKKKHHKKHKKSKSKDVSSGDGDPFADFDNAFGGSAAAAPQPVSNGNQALADAFAGFDDAFGAPAAQPAQPAQQQQSTNDAFADWAF